MAIAIDGSRATTPRTKSNEQAFCAKNYGKGKTAKYRKKKSKGMRRRRNAKAKPQPQAPQIWVTMMWHIGLGLPWCWKLGPSNASERQHVMDMLESAHFPEKTLFAGDAGFGYEALKQTFERRLLRSRNSERALVEMEWSLLGMTVIELLALKEQLQAKAADPRKLSFAKALRAVRESLSNLCGPPNRLGDLKTLLARALIDNYQRKASKAGRYRPNKKDKPSCGAPKIFPATATHRKRLKQLELHNAA